MDDDAFRRMGALEGRHWWYLALHDLVLRALRQAGPHSPDRLIDVGCGTGGLLLRRGRGIGLDSSPRALQLARSKTPLGLVRARGEALPIRGSCCGAVLALDVIYHAGVSADRAVLAEAARVLRPGGLLVLQAPAFAALRNRHDDFVAGARRYRRGHLGRSLLDSGFRIELLTYRMLALAPVLLVLALLNRIGVLCRGSNLAMPPEPLNRLLLSLSKTENRLVLAGVRVPVGSSLFCVARRTQDDGGQRPSEA